MMHGKKNIKIRYMWGEPTSLKLGAAHVHWTFWSPFSSVSDLLYKHKFNRHGPVVCNDDETMQPEPRYSDYCSKYYRATQLHLMPNLRMNGAIPLLVNAFVACIRKSYMLPLTFTWLSCINLLKPTGYDMHQQFNVQQLYALSTLYLCVLYLFENKQRLVPLTA